MWDEWAVLESINVADVQQDVTPCSKPRGTISGLSTLPGAGWSLFEKCHSVMSRPRWGHFHVLLPVAWHFSARCLFFSMFSLSALDWVSLEESSLLRSAKHHRGLAAPGFLGGKLSNCKLLLVFFGNFSAKVLFFFKAKGQWLIENLYFPQNYGLGK